MRYLKKSRMIKVVGIVIVTMSASVSAGEYISEQCNKTLLHEECQSTSQYTAEQCAIKMNDLERETLGPLSTVNSSQAKSNTWSYARNLNE